MTVQRHWIVIDLLGLLAALAALSIAALLPPDPRGFGTHTQLGLPPCPYLAATGRPCLTCGLTTAFSNLVRGRVGAAWSANPGAFPLFLAVVLAVPWFAQSLRRGLDPLRFTETRRGRRVLLLIVLSIVATWVARGLG